MSGIALCGRVMDEAKFKSWFNGADKLVDQANRQVKAADGAKIEWYFDDERVVEVIKQTFEERGVKGIDVYYKPPKVK